MLENMNRTKAALSLLRCLNRLTVTRAAINLPVFSALSKLLEALVMGKLFDAEGYYHEMTFALLNSGARRVTGNLFTDYIYFLILEKPNAFSNMAAKGFIDKPVYSAMREELSLLLTLSKFTTAVMTKWAEQVSGYKPDRDTDKITIMADAAWGGGNARPKRQYDISGEIELETKAQEQKLDMSYSFLSWDYGEFEFPDSFVADAALEEIYIRLGEGERAGLVDDLWNFFDAYGNGAFLQFGLLSYCSDTKSFKNYPHNFDELTRFSLHAEQADKLLQNTIRFMRDDEVNNMQIIGKQAVGKTSLVLSMAKELPEVRIVVMQGENYLELSEVFDRLSCQPLKFILLIDNSEGITEKLNKAIKATVQPANVIVYCISETDKLFSDSVAMEYPEMNSFCQYVSELLKDMEVDASMQQITNACMDYQLEIRSPLTYKAAERVVAKIITEQQY